MVPDANRLRAWRERLMIPAALAELPGRRFSRLWALAVVLLFALAVFVRASWFLTDELEPAYQHHGYPGLTSVDGYYLAAGVGAATSDGWGEGARVAQPSQHALVTLGAVLVELGLAREAVFTWLPPLVGALIVVPLFALGWMAGGRWVALLAGLGAAFAPAHVARTTIGYFDTDIFAVTVPLAVAALLAAALRTPSVRPPWTLFFGASLLAIYPFTYDQGRPLALGLAVAFAVVAWVGPRLGGVLTQWRPIGLLVLVAAASPLPVPWALCATAVVFGVSRWPWKSLERGERVVARPPHRALAAGAWVLLFGLVVFSPATSSLLKKAEVYAADSSYGDEGEDGGPWSETDTTPSVSEARTLPAEAMFAKAAGHAVPFVLGLIGLALLFFVLPHLGMVGPTLALGLFAFVGGHRFLVYLAPLLALGVAWIVVRVVAALPFPLLVRSRGPLTLLGAVCFVPAALATIPKKPRPVMVLGEVAALEELGTRAGRQDTTLAWWDYGYPIAYHARTRVVTDGARRGDEASLVAEILLTHDDELARRLALLMAGAELASPEDAGRLTLGRARKEGLRPEQWLERVTTGSWPPEGLARSGEVYLYLPLRMMPVIPTLAHYRVGPERTARLRRYTGVRPEGRRLILGDGLEVDADQVTLRRRDPSGAWQVKALRSIHSVGGSGARRAVRAKAGDPQASTAGVFLVDLALFVELDATLLESTWARLFLFEQPSPAFELVSSTAGAKVYRVRAPPR